MFMRLAPMTHLAETAAALKKSVIDLYSRMYPPLRDIKGYIEKMQRRPSFWWNTAMGNGPDDLEDYFRLIQENDVMCGYVYGNYICFFIPVCSPFMSTK